MFYYIYKLEKGIHESFSRLINGFDGSISNLKFKIVDIETSEILSDLDDYKFQKQMEITGLLIIKKIVQFSNKEVHKETNIPFRLRFGSDFAFISTEKEIERLESIKCLNNWLKEGDIKLIDFIPRREKVVSLIYDIGIFNSAKLSTYHGIQEIEDIEGDEKDILMDYPLIEANFDVKLNGDTINMFYYGDALQFPKSASSTQVDKSLQVFENILFEIEFTETSKNPENKAFNLI